MNENSILDFQKIFTNGILNYIFFIKYKIYKKI